MGIIEVKNLTKVYEKEGVVIRALQGITMEILEGSFVAITGASGSGKSTLLHILAGIDDATSGEVWISGIQTNRLSRDEKTVFRRKNIGLIYQFFNLVSVLTVAENILLPATLDGKKADERKLQELMERLHLEERKNHFPSELSGGQQQRVAIARAIYNKPLVVLADEPTGNLDSYNRIDVMNALMLLNKECNITVVMVTHDSELAAYADRIIRISDGQIVEDKEKANND
ncbi:MAG: ABC transporter ATP-binding protein [Lachnospiraceae bacterium]|nr:ABC transporter ATP-binding protein [Lachnospiraceae bacterium]